ncbi:MAG: metalloregulator ArsR/SmtB family transcription factor [Aquiluna sp.]|nr:metalloregulator ArsR/SmtB family transcription factor [Aquiluna sp.]
MTNLSLAIGECAPTKASAPLARSKAEDIATLLKAVSDPTRLQILALLAKAEQQEDCTCNLTEPLGLSQPTISHHLKKLAEVGLVEKQRRGTWIWYSINQDRWQELGRLFQ